VSYRPALIRTDRWEHTSARQLPLTDLACAICHQPPQQARFLSQSPITKTQRFCLCIGLLRIPAPSKFERGYCYAGPRCILRQENPTRAVQTRLDEQLACWLEGETRPARKCTGRTSSCSEQRRLCGRSRLAHAAAMTAERPLLVTGLAETTPRDAKPCPRIRHPSRIRFRLLLPSLHSQRARRLSIVKASEVEQLEVQ
jgi:hypothetical protein